MKSIKIIYQGGRKNNATYIIQQVKFKTIAMTTIK